MVTSRLKAAMRDSGINQTQLCELTGISKSGISQYCSGKIQPRRSSLEMIAAALNVPPSYLSGEDALPETAVKKKKLSVEEAARLMGVGNQFVRVGIRNGTLPFGSAVRFPSGKYRYYISPKRFTEFTGIETL